MIYQMNGLTALCYLLVIYLFRRRGKNHLPSNRHPLKHPIQIAEWIYFFVAEMNGEMNDRMACHCHCIHFSHTKNGASDECLVLRIEFKVAPDYFSDFTCSISIVRM